MKREGNDRPERNDERTAASPQERAAWRRITAAWDKGDEACRLELARRHTRDYPQNPAGWLALADVLAGFVRYDEAMAALRRAERHLPARRRTYAWIQRGHLYRGKGRLELAERWYRRAAAAEPSTRTFVFLGAVLARRGRSAEARRCYRRAIQLGSECLDEAHYNLGLLLRAEGRYREAIACFERALALDESYRIARRARQDCVRALALRHGAVGRGAAAGPRRPDRA